MTTEFQPVDPLIPFYIPENWIQPSASGGGSFVNFPTAQTANINFPGSISCSNIQSFAPTAPMNLFNNSTTGNIEIANAVGYTGGIVVNANGFAPASNTIRIGDSSRAVIAPYIKTSAIEGQGFLGSIINVNSDLNVGSGFQVNTNRIEPTVSAALNIASSNNVEVNIGTPAVRSQNINIGTNNSVVASTGSVNIMTGNRHSGNFSVLTSTNVENTGAITLGNFRGELRLYSVLTNPITISTYNPTNADERRLTGSIRPATTLLATANVNGVNRYVYVYSPISDVTGNYYVNICITFECSTHFSPWLQWSVYRNTTGMTTNTTVAGGDTLLNNFSVIQKYYTGILTDKMVVNLSGIVNFNPLNNPASGGVIGVAVKWLDFVSGTFTLVQLSTVATYTRLA